MCPPPSSLPPPPQRQQPPPPPQQRQQPPSPRQQPPSPSPHPPSPRQQPPSPHQPTPPRQQLLSPHQPTPPRQSPSPRQQLLSPPQPTPPHQSPSPRQQPPDPHQPTPPRQPPPPPHQPTHPPPPPPPQQHPPPFHPPVHHPPPPQQPPSPPPQLQPPPQQPPYPQPAYPPYHYLHERPKKKSSTLASCFLATSFLTFITIAAIITCFILFRPQNPQISVHSMKFPSFSLQNGTADFTFFQYVAVRNPNRYAFSHYDSSLQLFSSSSGPLGFMYIPAGNIAAGKTQFMSATFDVKSFTLPPDVSGPQNGPGPTMELETKMKLMGSVKVLKIFAHHVEKGAKCRVSIQVSDGSVLGYNC